MSLISFPYMGGKSYMLDRIYEIMPPHSVFLEPLSGGAVVTLNKPRVELEVINDINKDIIDFFLVCREQFDELYRYLVNTPYSRELYYDWLHRWKTGWRPENRIEKVATWYFLQATAFSGDFGAGFSTGKEKNQAIGFVHKVDNLYRIRDRLRGVFIENKDYQEVLEYYDSEEVFCYLDPPYMVPGADGYYRAGAGFDHERLASVVHKLKAKVMVSYYDNPEVRRLYKDWNFEKYVVPKYSFGANTGGEETGIRPMGEELLITNYTALPLFRFAELKEVQLYEHR